MDRNQLETLSFGTRCVSKHYILTQFSLILDKKMYYDFLLLSNEQELKRQRFIVIHKVRDLRNKIFLGGFNLVK